MASSRHTLDDASIVGRDAECAALRKVLERAGAGNGALVLVSGDAGIGKTTLARFLIREARRSGFTVFAGGCYDLEATPPYGPWIEAIRDYEAAEDQPQAPGWLIRPDSLKDLDGQPALFEDARRFFSAISRQRPVLVVLEDLHWSDPASLEMLRYLARKVEATALILAATLREDDLLPNHPLRRLMPQLVREAQAERIILRGLDDCAVRALVHDRYSLNSDDESRLVDYLQSRSAGNPFFLTEVLHVLETERILKRESGAWRVGDLESAPVPPVVAQIIEDRLAKLDEQTRNLLEVAAVIGQEVPLDVWQAASDAGSDAMARALRKATKARLVAETPAVPGIAFSHSLIRQTLYQSIILPRRQEIHRHVADVLMRRAEPPPHIVASHLASAGDPRAIDWLVRAGERTLAIYAAQDAAALLTRAHDLAARFARDLPVDAYRTRGTAYTILGEFEQARRDYETALERSRSDGDLNSELQTLLDLGLLWAARDYEHTGRYYHAALDLARAGGDMAMVAFSLNRIANWHVNQDRPDVALPLHREALRLFEEAGDLNGIADTLDLLGMASYLSCDLRTSTDYEERAIRLLREQNDRQRLSTCLAAIAMNGGDPACGSAAPVYREDTFWTAAAEEGLAIAREIDWPAGQAFAYFALSMARAARGDLGRARDDAENSLEIARRIGHRQWMVAAGFALGLVWIELLHPERAEVELEQALTLARASGSLFWTSMLASVLASLMVAENELDRASAILASVAVPDLPGVSMGQRQCWFARAELELARGNGQRALAIVSKLAESAPSTASSHGIPHLMKLHGDVLARSGQIEDAERGYHAARNSAALFGFLPLLWRIDAARSHLYRQTRRAQEAEEAAGCASETIEILAGNVDDGTIRETFRDRALAQIFPDHLGGQRAATAVGLSPRELDVLKLLAEGKSNQEIAEALFISPRTVMRHVTAILTKLDVPSRTAAAALAIREGIV